MKAYKWSDSLRVVIRTADGVRVPTVDGAKDNATPDVKAYREWIAAGNTPDLPDCSGDPNLPPLEFAHLLALHHWKLPFVPQYLDAARLSPALIAAFLDGVGLSPDVGVGGLP